MRQQKENKTFLRTQNSIWLFALLLFFIQNCCNTNTHSDIHCELEDNQYLGEWYSVERGYPFSAILSIDSNYTFTYDGGGCVSYLCSEGVWTLCNDTLILNSYEPQECYFIHEFDPTCSEKNDSSIYRKPRTNIGGCTPAMPWYEYIIFKNVKFLVIDSILTHIPLCPEINFIRE